MYVSIPRILRVYWYDAAIKNRADHRDIAQQHHVKLRLGHLNSVGEQKGVDPLIIMDMITLSQNRACDEMVLLSGDADLIVGVLQAQERGVRVHLLGIVPSRANQSPLLREEADTCSEWGKDIVSGFLRLATPEDLKTRQFSPRSRGFPLSRVGAPERVGTPAEARSNTEKANDGVPSIPAPTPQVTASSSSDVRSSPDLALFRAVVDAVLPQLSEPDREAILSSPRPGVVPGNVDRQLLGTAKRMLNSILTEPEKRVLRRLLYEGCRDRRISK